MLPPHSCGIKHQRTEKLNGICVRANHRFKQTFDCECKIDWRNQRVFCYSSLRIFRRLFLLTQ